MGPVRAWLIGLEERRPRQATVLLSVVLLGLGAWYAAGKGPDFVLTSGDDFAYASAAIDLAGGSSLVHRFDSPAFASLYVRVAGLPDAYASMYPPGVSLLLVPLYLVAGYRGLFALGPLMAVLGVVALHGLSWQLTQRRVVALLAAALLATLPPLVFLASGIGSDVPSLAMVPAALSVYLRHLQRPRPATFWLFSFLAGASFLIRNPNVLLFGAPCVHQIIVHRGRLRAQAAAWGGGCLVFGAFVALQVGFNLATFGSLVGGYEQETFVRGSLSLSYLPHHLPRYLMMLCAVPPLGFVAMLVVTARRRAERDGVYVLFASLVLAFVVFYSAWRAFNFDYRHAFIGGTRFLQPALPILCLFVAIAALDSIAAVGARRAVIAACLLAQLGASTVLTHQLRQFKGRMAVHRDRIYGATVQDALVLGPAEWNKLLFPRDGTGRVRRYASYEGAMRGARNGQEVLRIVAEALRADRPAYVLGSGSRRTSDEDGALTALRAHYRLVRVIEDTEPYELRVDQILPR